VIVHPGEIAAAREALFPFHCERGPEVVRDALYRQPVAASERLDFNTSRPHESLMRTRKPCTLLRCSLLG